MNSTIRWIVSQTDTDMRTDEVAEDIRSRCADARERGHDISPEREAELVDEAVSYFTELKQRADFEIWALRQ